ncbi:hypothetical protein LZ32DRAFT_406442 [Colletotrichum eremochloae]|nr:hypothetical protein LZ32DRAFT_406442 [Colletotrichum eremochloae]
MRKRKRMGEDAMLSQARTITSSILPIADYKGGPNPGQLSCFHTASAHCYQHKQSTSSAAFEPRLQQAQLLLHLLSQCLPSRTTPPPNNTSPSLGLARVRHRSLPHTNKPARLAHSIPGCRKTLRRRRFTPSVRSDPRVPLPAAVRACGVLRRLRAARERHGPADPAVRAEHRLEFQNTEPKRSETKSGVSFQRNMVYTDCL